MERSSPPKITYELPGGLSTRPRPERIVVGTPQGGSIAIDSQLLHVWEYADERSPAEICTHFSKSGMRPEAILGSLACLVEAGLLVRSIPRQPENRPRIPELPGELVSVVIVNYNSLDWLGECLPSLQVQTYRPLEIIVVDNGSAEHPGTWLRENFEQVKLIELDSAQSLAYALNRGVEAAQGEFFLLLNPDVRLEPNAVSELVLAAGRSPECAAVAAKLKFWWAPGFLNGLGNYVRPFTWGADIGLGHLDLGQLDDLETVPSACFAAALIAKAAWHKVGPLDEAFPLYYEDVEWSYRARMMGYRVRAAPKAVGYHAFGRRVHTGEEVDLTSQKLGYVVYGRLRFIAKLGSLMTIAGFLVSYLLVDIGLFWLHLFRGEASHSKSIILGWRDFLRDLASLRRLRKQVQSLREVPDAELFPNSKSIPPALIWRGIPVLTWNVVTKQYLPLIQAGKTRQLPEFQ